MIPFFQLPGARTDDPDRTITDSSLFDDPSARKLPHVPLSRLLPTEFDTLNALYSTSRTLPYIAHASVCIDLVRREPQRFSERRLERLVGICYGEIHKDEDVDRDWAGFESLGLPLLQDRSLRAELLHALKAFWEKEVLSSKKVIPKFDVVRQGDTQRLLSTSYATTLRKPGMTRQDPIARQDFEVFKFVDPMEIREEPRWAEQELSMGRLLSVSDAGDLRDATDIHLIHANSPGCEQIRVPALGDVVLVVTPTEYQCLRHGLFEGAQRQRQIRVLVMKEDNASEVCRRLHTVQWVVDMLKGASGAKRLYMLEGNVKTMYGERLHMGFSNNTIERIAQHSGVSKGRGFGGFRCAVWHIAQPESALEPMQFALQVLRFLPADFGSTPGFLHFCLDKAGMGFGTIRTSPLTWEEDRLRSPSNLERPAPFEETYGNPQRLQTIQDEIQNCDDLSALEKQRICALYQSFFKDKVEFYEARLKETQQKLSTLGESVIDTSNVLKMKTKLADSVIRQELYDVMNRFMVSENHRVLFVTAPCGVGKTLALSLLSVERAGQGAWFSFPTNMLAKQFVKDAPRNLVSVHCEGDVKGSDLPKLDKHAINLHNAVFVHPTLLSAIRPEGDLRRFDGLTIFVDEWHNLGDKQLEDLLDSLKATGIKLVLLSATPRENQCETLRASFPQACQQHEVSVDRAIEEKLLRPRLVFDGTDTSTWRGYLDALEEAIRATPLEQEEFATPTKPKLKQTPFDLRFDRALATLDVTIDDQALWQRSGVIYLNNIKNAKKICDDLRKKYPKLAVFNATGDCPEVPDFTARPFALVCCKRFKEGANIQALGYVMTLAPLTDTDAIQIGGRLSRKSDRPDELPFGLFFAFGDGSSEKEILRSDRVGEDGQVLQTFLQRCRTPGKQELTRHLPLVPAVADIFPFTDVPGLIQMNLELLQRTKYNEENSIKGMLLGHKRHRSDESVS